MRISALEGQRVALWGFGREGRAAWSALRRRFPVQPLTVFCPAGEREQVDALGDAALQIEHEPTPERLAGFDVVIKSPGISPYSPLAEQARALGAVFTSGTALWFAEQLPGRTLCITGTKGKSTTSALTAHLLRAAGLRVGLAGNIGLPLLELIDAPQVPDVWVIELSSYQAADARAPDVAMVLNLFPEHLDWHGSEARYFADKLALIDRARPGHVLLDARDARLQAWAKGHRDVAWFGDRSGWHLRGEHAYRADECVFDAARMPLSGEHNRINLCAALTAIDALGIDARPLARHAATFHSLPHRLQRLGVRDGIEYVDDSISTTPHASLAALDCFRDRPVAILVGGYDRGVDWQAFAERVAVDPPLVVIAMGQNGPRIHALLSAQARRGYRLELAGDLESALSSARRALGSDGVVLLSPGAPSFPTFRDYADRGRRFAELAGFHDSMSDAMPGLGIR